MQLTTTLLAALTAATTATAFVIETYTDGSCNDYSQRVNIWDSTCATWPSGFSSFKIRTWGGRHQKAYFFAPNNCGSLPDAIQRGYVDSTTKDYELGTCYDFDGASANAISSYRA